MSGWVGGLCLIGWVFFGWLSGWVGDFLAPWVGGLLAGLVRGLLSGWMDSLCLCG